MYRTRLWSDSFYSFDLSDKINNNELLEYYEEYRKDNPEGVVKSNRGGWQQPIYPNTDARTDKLFRQVNKCCTKVMRNLNAPHTYLCGFAWINSNLKGDHNSAHTHPGSAWAGVYYIKQKPKMGSIVFQRHENFSYARLGIEGEMEWEESGRCRDEQFKLDYVYTPREGEFILFPSWLEHSVTANELDEERLNIAFNFGHADIVNLETNSIETSR